MSEPILTREDAKALVAKIRNDNGGVSPEDEAGMKKYYPAAWEALRSVRRKLGSATKTLATNLYSKDTRFLYELIQNADDNQYMRATANSHDPYLSFSLYPDRLVIDSNEDGFTTENVKAICSIGQSTKTVAQGYIGEKGIGFKSVFKIAQRVHVQSGPFSFSFNNTPGSDDDGLGMVTPLIETYEDLPQFIGTRMTLGLLNSLDFCERAKELSYIPDTLLLFLRKLRSIQVNIYPAAGDATQIKYSCHRGQTPGVETAEKHSRSNSGQWIVEKRNFRVARRTIRDLPYDAAREHTNQADVVLAFPVNETNDAVVLQKQHVYAYLPLRPVGFNFLIQSDFITQASREDVFHSRRNQALLRGVAETFRDAVLGFCEHDTLQYQWMRYLPDDSVSDEFWKQLQVEIEDLLKRTPVLRSWSGRLCRPDQLRFVTADARDQYGEPLFTDLSEEIYLGPRYTFSDFQLLKGLGTWKICIRDVLDRVEGDLKKPNSKMKTIASEDDWHSRVADLLLKHLERNSRVKTLPLIPLADGSWVSAASINPFSPIYFPVSGFSEIPTDLGYQLVDPDTIKNDARKKLFARLGVTYCDPKSVISAIHSKHTSANEFSINQTIPHLRFLFFNLPADSRLERDFYLVAEEVGLVNLRSRRAYFPGSHNAYDAKSVFHPQDSALSRHPAKFIHPLYLEAVPNSTRSHGTSLSVWLEEFGDVKKFPRLFGDWGWPSGELDFVLDHRSDILLGLLHEHWPHYASTITTSADKRIKTSEVPSQGDAMVQLEGSYMPLPRLIKIAESCGVSKACFFVRAPSTLRDEDGESWEFLSRFGVRFVDDVDFYMKLLDSIKSVSGDEEDYSPETEEAIFKIYNGMMRKCITEENCSKVRSFFKKGSRVYHPSSQMDQAGWYPFEGCVWDGPDWLEVRLRLSVVTEYQNLRHLLKNILDLRDANWNDSLGELSSMREYSEMDLSKASQIYRSLWRDFEKDSNHEVLRSRFEEDSLIFVPSRNAWFPPSSCLWADNKTRIPDKTPISTPYAPLREFFCQMLQVQKPDLQMYIEGLKQLAKEKPPSIPRIKESIGLISIMDPSANDLKSLRSANIFPVRLPSGDVKLTNASVDFAIVDRKEYDEAFKDLLITLDFSFNEIHTCRPFLLALSLGRRFMSAAVEEKTMVQGGFADHNLTHTLREKAHALYRISTHFNSTKIREGDQTVFDLFKRATVYVSERISKSISLTQSLQTFTVERSRANFHIEESDGRLKLYVPSDKRNRELCYLQQLPKRVLHFLSISNPSAVAVLVQVLGSSSLDIVDAILEDAGIIELDIPATSQDIKTGLDHGVQLSEGQTYLASPTNQDSVSLLVENERSARAEHYRDQKQQGNRDSSPNSLEPSSILAQSSLAVSTRSGRIIRSDSVVEDLNEEDFDNSSASTASDSGRSSTSLSHSVSSVEESASSHWLDSFLQASSDYDNSGTGKTPFQPHVEDDKDRLLSNHFQSITLQQPYKDLSFEELRLYDYYSSVGPFLKYPTAVSHESKEYAELLDRLINSASTAQFPYRNEVPKAIITPRSTSTTIFGTRSLNRDRKVGAAGELYAFELLERLGLPGFDTCNWKSTIRKEVRVCDKYRNLEPWNGSETSDIVYVDTEGSLTKILVNKGYLPSVTVVSSSPTYYLEVKTTTGQYNEPFFMSGSQYKRMDRMALRSFSDKSEIYVLLRVYNVENEGVGMRVYVDPCRAKEEKELSFTVNTWAVQPMREVRVQD